MSSVAVSQHGGSSARALSPTGDAAAASAAESQDVSGEQVDPVIAEQMRRDAEQAADAGGAAGRAAA